jgi:DHA2 family multidrug resistance protein
MQRMSAMTSAFMARGADADAARRMALTVFDRQLLGQASAIAFSKVYLLSGLLLVLTLPLLMFVRHTRPNAPSGPSVAAE